MKILVAGTCGYKGYDLLPRPLERGYEVVAFDSQWFGNFIEPGRNLSVFKCAVHDIETIPLDSVDCIIDCFSNANDSCDDLNPKLTWVVDALATMQ